MTSKARIPNVDYGTRADPRSPYTPPLKKLERAPAELGTARVVEAERVVVTIDGNVVADTDKPNTTDFGVKL